jgi:hypothetical protein
MFSALLPTSDVIRWRHGPLCCRRANGALRFVLTIDFGPSLPPTEILTGALVDPVEALAAARDYRALHGKSRDAETSLSLRYADAIACKNQSVADRVRHCAVHRRRDTLGSDRQRARRVRSTVLRGEGFFSFNIAPAGLIGAAIGVLDHGGVHAAGVITPRVRHRSPLLRSILF